MAAEQSARQRSVKAARWFALAYVLASLMAPLVGKAVIDMLPPMGNSAFIALFCALGPLAPLVAGFLDLFGIPLYLLATALLAGCLLILNKKNVLARVCACIAAPIIWIASGYLVILAMASI